MNQAAKGDNSFGSIHSLFDRGLLDSHSKDCEPSWSPQPFEVSALLSILGIWYSTKHDWPLWVRDQMDQYGAFPYTFNDVVFSHQWMDLEPKFVSRRRFNAVMSSLKNLAMRCYCRMLCAASTTAGLFGGAEAVGRQGPGWNDSDEDWDMITVVQSAPSWSQLSHSPSQTLDISTIRSCPRHLYVRTEVASTCPCSALRPLWCHWKAGQINVLSAKGGPYFYPNAKPWLQFNSMSILLKVIWPQPKPPTSPWPSPQLPSSRCLAKGALWRSLGFLGGLVQRSSVGLQPSWGRYLPSTSDLAHGNGVVAATTCSHGGWTQSQCRQQPEAQESRQPKD